jgi:hypothetical protein
MHSRVALSRSIRKPVLLCAVALLFAAVVRVPVLSAAEHTLLPSPQTVHIGYFLSSLKPVLTIDSGDIVTLESAPSIVRRSSINPASYRPAPCRSISATSIVM